MKTNNFRKKTFLEKKIKISEKNNLEKKETKNLRKKFWKKNWEKKKTKYLRKKKFGKKN